MIVFQIMYPYSENREFDMTYYLNNHLATARKLLGTACLKVEIADNWLVFCSSAANI